MGKNKKAKKRLLYWLTVASLIVATIANIISCIKSFL